MKINISAFVVLSCLLVGCSKTTEPGQSTSVAKVANGQQVVGTNEYSMTVSKEWLMIDMTTATAASIEKTLKGTEFASSLPVVTGFVGNRMIKTFGFIPELKGKTSANINVIVIDTPGTAKEILDGNETQMKAMDKTSTVLKDFVPIKDSRTITAAIMGQKMIAMVVAQNSKQYVVTLTTPPTVDSAKAQAVAKAVFSTFVAK